MNKNLTPKKIQEMPPVELCTKMNDILDKVGEHDTALQNTGKMILSAIVDQFANYQNNYTKKITQQ